MGDLALGLGISCSTAMECIATLEGQGRVMRQPFLSDPRHVVVGLTPKAEAVASQVLSKRKVIIEKVMQQLSPNEYLGFAKGLLLLANGAQSWMAQLRAPGEGALLQEETLHA